MKSQAVSDGGEVDKNSDKASDSVDERLSVCEASSPSSASQSEDASATEEEGMCVVVDDQEKVVPAFTQESGSEKSSELCKEGESDSPGCSTQALQMNRTYVSRDSLPSRLVYPMSLQHGSQTYISSKPHYTLSCTAMEVSEDVHQHHCSPQLHTTASSAAAVQPVLYSVPYTHIPTTPGKSVGSRDASPQTRSAGRSAGHGSCGYWPGGMPALMQKPDGRVVGFPASALGPGFPSSVSGPGFPVSVSEPGFPASVSEPGLRASVSGSGFTTSVSGPEFSIPVSGLTQDVRVVHLMDPAAGSYLPGAKLPHETLLIQGSNPQDLTPEMCRVFPSEASVQPGCKTLVRTSDSAASSFPPTQDKTLMQSSDVCGGGFVHETGLPQDNLPGKRLFHPPKPAQDTTAIEHSVPLPPFYPMDGTQVLQQDFASLQQQQHYSVPDNLPSCAVEARPGQESTQKHPLMDSNSALLSSVSNDQPASFHSVEHSFPNMQQGGALSGLGLVSNTSTEDLEKLPPVSSVSLTDACQYHGSLSSLATDFNFSTSAAPMISVDQPSQTVLPSVGYSPPGLSNQGMASPNLFSPLGLGTVEQNTASKEDRGLQVVTSLAGGVAIDNSGGSGGGASGGLPNVSAAGE